MPLPSTAQPKFKNHPDAVTALQTTHREITQMLQKEQQLEYMRVKLIQGARDDPVAYAKIKKEVQDERDETRAKVAQMSS